jgi:hypothetical protein
VRAALVVAASLSIAAAASAATRDALGGGC